MHELVVLGTASQAPTRARNHNGYLLRLNGEGLLFDPGEGTQRQMVHAGVASSRITRICLTHVHGDHCLGLPGVLSRMALDGVAHPVHLHYPASGEDVVRALVSLAAPGSTVTGAVTLTASAADSESGIAAVEIQLQPAWRCGPCTTAWRPTATGWPSPTAGPCCRSGSRRPGSRAPRSAASRIMRSAARSLAWASASGKAMPWFWPMGRSNTTRSLA